MGYPTIGTAGGIAPTLDGLDDTTITAAAKGDILVFDGTNWVDGPAIGINNTVLTADSAEATGTKWAAAGGGAAQLSELTDVNTSTPTNKFVLVADGVDFESRALLETDISNFGSYETADVTILKDADIGVSVQAYDATYLVDADIGGSVAAFVHTHSYQPLDTDLTNIAALTITAGFLKTDGANTWSVDTATYSLSSHTHAGVYEPADATILKDADIGSTVQAYAATNALTTNITYEQLNTNGDVGTIAGTLAIGNHTHTGVYEPADATILKDADIGSTVQAYNATYVVDADIGVTVQAYDATAYIPATEKAATNGVATLDGTGKVPSAQMPPIAISSTYVVATELLQLALTVQEGDVAVRSDENKSYIALNATNTTMGDWQLLLTPTDAVLTVDGRTGTVTLSDLYEPIDATILKDADIGVSVQAYDATIVVAADIGSTVQAYDLDLTNIAALTASSGFLKTNGVNVWSVDTASYEPADGTILKDADIGVTVQAYDATYVVDADIGVSVQAYDATNVLDADVTYELLNTNGDVGTIAGTLAIGNHTHTGVYEPADATIVKDADIGVTVQAYDATIVVDADIGVSVQAYDATIVVDADIGSTVAAQHVTMNNQTGTTYTMVLTDDGKNVTMNNAAANTLTIPANASVAYPIGTQILITQLGAGLTTVAITTDTLNVAATFTKVLAEQYSEAVITKKTATMWVISGDLVAA